ncbi:glycoside hydrolase family 2 protein [Sunxiuqinia sp. sy24]|uniref:glycoside hydrolase family 2 protein n=1 Tax=Sunxiuqinia sp. sy24 TaxID=3461495 RepID=UPI004045B707
MFIKRLFPPALFVLLFCTFANPIDCIAQQDFFAEIGNKIQNERYKLLEEKIPPVLPDIVLPFDRNDKNKFVVQTPQRTPAQVKEQLQQARNTYLPFLKELAPQITSYRKRIPLKNFQWRQETTEDQKNFIAILQGQGTWEQVTVPHFDAPYGRAVTYYFKELNIPEETLNGQELFLCFKGVDYKASVFLNGTYVGSHEGFFAPFEFNVSKFTQTGKNTLLVKVENDYTTTGFVAAGKERIFGDKIYGVTGLGYDNFNDGGHQCAAGMGIYQDCYLETRNAIHIEDVFVRPLYDEGMAELRLQVNNFNEERLPVTFQISVFGQNFEATVLKDSLIIPSALHIPGIGDLQKPTDWEQSSIKLGYGVNYFFYKIPMSDFRSWSNETPWLYQAQVKVLNENKQVTDTYKQSFGMRSFKMDTVSIPKGRLYFNNEKIRLRGANSMGFLQQDVYQKDWDQLIDDLLLAKVCNMNFIRLTQRPVQPEIYEYADKLGIMLQTDFPTFGGIRYNQWEECVRQSAEMERLIRNHPSNILVTYINERFPNGEGHPHRNMAQPEEYFSLFRAMDEAIHKENPDRVIKKSDGDYDPPTPGLPDNHCYNTWYNGQGLGIGKLVRGYWQWVKPGWYYGCGEFGAEALDPVETMYKYYPKEWLPKNKADEKNWTANRIYAAQTHKFHYMWYNTQYSLIDWVEASHEHQAWALETVTEAFRRDTNMVTFAMHLFIDAWPAGWMKTIMDVDRNPKKGFFAYQEALKPTIVSLRTDRHHFWSGEQTKFETWICHDPNTTPQDYVLKYQLEQNGRVVYSGQSNTDIPANSSRFQGNISFKTPKVNKRTTYQLRAALFDGNGKQIDATVNNLDVFPAQNSSASKKVTAMGNTTAQAQYILETLQIENNKDFYSSDIILINDFQLFNNNKEEFEQLAKSGKRIILFDVPVGKHQIGDTEITVQNTSMGSYYFASPQTGHRFTKDARPFDFRMWFDEKEEYIMPFLNKIVIAEGWSPILSSGNTNWVKDDGKAAAVAELPLGKGEIIICELEFVNKLKTNPTAQIFLTKLLQHK